MAVAAVDERIAGEERPAALDPEHQAVRLHARKRIDPVAERLEALRLRVCLRSRLGRA